VNRGRDAAAGATAALLWAVLEPIDKRVFGHDYSDVAVLGKAVTRSRLWPLAGLALHAGNGAIFGLAFGELRRRTQTDPRRLALRMALVEHAVLFPLGAIVDRRHPARGSGGLAPLYSARALGQATARHALFGAVLGRLAA
jgi:hypothetical protein